MMYGNGETERGRVESDIEGRERIYNYPAVLE